MRSIRDISILENVPVLVRASLNVPTKDGKVENTFRLKSALPTIQYLTERHARVVLLSHITGKGTETLEPMYEAMRQWIPNLHFCPVSVGPEARAAVRDLLPGHVLMLENLRRNKGEEQNDEAFAKELSMLGDVFVQDSFDVCHREHASTVGIPAFIPSYAGLLVETEVKQLSKALKPKRPAIAIIGGSKFTTKEPVLNKLLKTYDHVFVGGALANDFLEAKGFSVGASLVSKEGQGKMRELLKNKRLITPQDVMVAPVGADRSKGRVTVLSDVQPGEAVLDAGPQTAKELAKLVSKSKTVLWNGPLGLFEHGFGDATRTLISSIAQAKAHSIVGGGDTVEAIEELGVSADFSFISTGGGAMLDYLAYGTLPGLEVFR